ncbi:MAG: hypothetical protein RL520_1902, partial [Pseudomonadota bacterium]
GDSVSQSRKPFGVGFSLLDLHHALMYPMGNIFVKLGLESLCMQMSWRFSTFA